jgi:hypothetical protein
MDFFHSLGAARAMVVLGAVAGLSGLLLYFSCRCIAPTPLGTRLMKAAAFMRFYKFHCWLWPVFWLALIAHLVFAISYIGWP